MNARHEVSKMTKYRTGTLDGPKVYQRKQQPALSSFSPREWQTRGGTTKKAGSGGLGVSDTARPLIESAFGWSWVLALRFMGRVRKQMPVSIYVDTRTNAVAIPTVT